MSKPNETKRPLEYDPETGVFTWKKREGESRHVKTWNTRFSGKAAGHVNNEGYRSITLMGENVLAHRLAWLYVYGDWPKGQIDHINGVRTDNRIANLRAVDHAINGQNQAMPSNNSSGRVGVSWHKSTKKWTAHICKNRVTTYLGLFANFEDACNARAAAEAKLGFHKNHGRVSA